jgi:hypothetical protein
MRKRIEKICTHCLRTFLVDIYQALCPVCGADLAREIDKREVQAWIWMLLLKEIHSRYKGGRHAESTYAQVNL